MKMKMMLMLVLAGCLIWPAVGQESSDLSQRWRLRFDIGGTIPENPTLSEIGGPVTGGSEMELSAGIAFDLAAGYRVTPWLLLEAELGLVYNEIESVGNWLYPNSGFSQLLMMVNAEFSYPVGRLVPFAGIGGGGVYSSVSFGNNTYYDYWFSWSEYDGRGDDFVPAAQAFAGLRFEFSENWSAGVTYRFLATPSQDWDVDWWNGADFKIGVDRVFIHSICFTITGSF